LGLELAKRHPGWLHAYIGVGQMTDGPEGERRGFNINSQVAADWFAKVEAPSKHFVWPRSPGNTCSRS
jgi:hypothetical protein